LISLAELLGKTIAEIEEISLCEYHEWIAYFEVKRSKDDGR